MTKQIFPPLTVEYIWTGALRYPKVDEFYVWFNSITNEISDLCRMESLTDEEYTWAYPPENYAIFELVKKE